MKGKYYILTFGCQMNKNDSERIAGLLSSLGLKEGQNPGQAEVLIINTCSVRQHAEDRVYGIIREWQKFRKNKPQLFIGVTGCMPGRDKNGKLQKKIKGVDWFFPISDLPLLPGKLNFGRDALQCVSTHNNYLNIKPKNSEKFRAFVSIQTGCDNFFTYCIVPHSRGRERNRPLKEILLEIKKLARQGCKEVTLLGQVVNNYRLQATPARRRGGDYRLLHKCNPFKKKDDFAALLWEINQIKGIERINWTAADPQYFNKYQIQALTLPHQVNYLHLPVQSGDNGILKKMNRKYTREEYLALVKKIKKARPGIALGTDIIVGFCGETKKQFKNTLDLYKKCAFDISYHAQYSERPGTVAAKMFKDDVPRLEKKRRWQAVQALMEKIVRRKNQKYVGQTVSVLVDKCAGGYCYGNSNEMKLVRFLGVKKLLGQIVNVKIQEAKEWILYGTKTA